MVIPHRLALVAAVLGGCSFQSASPGPDAPAPPNVAFEFDKSGADEQIGTVKLPVVLSKPSDTVVTVSYSVLSAGNAIPTMDFAISSNEVRFEAGVTRAEISVEILSDFDDAESDETFTIALADPVGAKLDELKAIHEVKIADHILPRVKWATASVDTNNLETVATTLTIELTAPSEGQSTVVLGVAGGAVAPFAEEVGLADATLVTIPNGMTSVTVPLNIDDDNRDEPDQETFTIELKGASQNMVLSPTDKIATHTIIDNEVTPNVEFTAAANASAEAGGNITVTVTLSGPSEFPLAVSYARDDGGDTANAADASVGGGGSLAFTPFTPGNPGQTVQTFDIAVTNDVFDENSETVIVNLSGPSKNLVLGNATTHTLTINADANDPPPTVTFVSPPNATVDEDLVDALDIEVVLNVESGKTVDVDFTVGGTATSGTDFVLAPGTVSFAPGQTSRNITVDVQNTNGGEPDETVIIDLTNPSNATVGTPGTFTLTITD